MRLLPGSENRKRPGIFKQSVSVASGTTAAVTLVINLAEKETDKK